MPLFAQVGRNNDQDAAALGPTLRDDETGLDSFPEPNFIVQDDTTRKRALAGKQCCLDLMLIEVNLRVPQGRGQRFYCVARRATGQQPRVILALVWRELLLRYQFDPPLLVVFGNCVLSPQSTLKS